jgi:carbon catabolite-derepressing protein kinase
MLAIFKALKAMGADWEVPPIRKAGGRSGSRASQEKADSRSRDHSQDSSVDSHSSHDEVERSDDEAPRRGSLSVRNANADEQETRGRSKKHYNHANDWGYRVPEDPWVINARFRKDGMFAPGVAHPSSTHSSRVDLHRDPSGQRRRSSTTTSTSSNNHLVEGMTAADGTGDDTEPYPQPDEAVWIYMSIQLYSIDRDFFVVDFKCAGYERLVSNLVREIKASSTADTSISNLNLSSSQPTSRQHEDGWDDEQGVWRRLDEGEPLPDDVAREGGQGVLRERTEEVGAGRTEGNKVCTSPFPFLDVASTLILQLSGE